MPSPRAAQNLQMPQPWDWQTDQVGKCPAVAQGGEGGLGLAGGGWAQLESTEA